LSYFEAGTRSKVVLTLAPFLTAASTNPGLERLYLQETFTFLLLTAEAVEVLAPPEK
jgi:hypothetical protein